MSDTDKDDATEVQQDESVVEQELELSADEEPDMAAKLAEAEAKAQENWDLLLRSRADLENVRRRAEQDVEKAHKFSIEKFAKELLPIMDSLEMGVEAAKAENADLDKVREGSELTLKMFGSVMEKFKVEIIHPIDEPFDPELHQAMSMLESPDRAPNTVINVMQKGYTLNDRLIRPAMVVVSKAPAVSDDANTGQNIDTEA